MQLSAQEYATLVEQAPIMIWRSDLSMGCDYFNERWLAFTGRTLEQERGNGWAEGVHAEDFDRCLAIYTTSFAARMTFEMEYRLRRHDGAWRWIFDRGVPSFDANGVFLGFIGSCVDVTTRVEAERALEARRQEELRELRELIPICAHCKQVRDDKGYWHRVESYVSSLTHKQFTHGVCPACRERYYPDL
ncbi:MAG TPA: PAS domain S-box protein [Anaeromyxobacteraceae bacterium]|nr:PAS domain S-box protein [Anaeromyxobacteraceae bacterium]